MRSREIIKILEKEGWFLVAVKGSHHQYKHSVRKSRVTIPHPNSDFPKGTLASIFKQAGIDKNRIKVR